MTINNLKMLPINLIIALTNESTVIFLTGFRGRIGVGIWQFCSISAIFRSFCLVVMEFFVNLPAKGW